MTPTGLEHLLKTPEKSPIAESSGAESGAVVARIGPEAVDAELQAVIEAWPELSAAIRAGILAMVAAASPKASER